MKFNIISTTIKQWHIECDTFSARIGHNYVLKHAIKKKRQRNYEYDSTFIFLAQWWVNIEDKKYFSNTEKEQWTNKIRLKQ